MHPLAATSSNRRRRNQAVSLLSPLRYYLEIGLGVFLKGVGLEVLWRQTVTMAALGLGVFALGLGVFRRRLA
ncbi:MAG: hypothetical protein HYY96_04015 [Candidatus Tectomicrobia bacterium]|nr:hypothetical protein [Candidatus Tectomicrobia bacterium]